MELTINIDMGNAAFELDPAYEVERILKEQVFGVELDDETLINLKDLNGNTVGQAYTSSKIEVTVNV